MSSRPALPGAPLTADPAEGSPGKTCRWLGTGRGSAGVRVEASSQLWENTGLKAGAVEVCGPAEGGPGRSGQQRESGTQTGVVASCPFALLPELQ